jgi:hypothetical protein
VFPFFSVQEKGDIDKKEIPNQVPKQLLTYVRYSTRESFSSDVVEMAGDRGAST